MNWIGLVPLGIGGTLVATAGVGAGLVPPGIPLAGVAIASAGAVGASLQRSRGAAKVDDLEGFRAKLEKTLGEPTSLRVIKKDRHGPLRIAVTYPAMFDDTIANQLKVADLVNRRLPGRWDSEWDTVGNRFEAWRRPDMPDKIDRPVKPDVARFPLGVTEAHKPAAWVPAVMPHALVVGATGAGKSVLISGLVMHAAASGWEVRIVDGKGTTLAGFRNWPGVTMCGFGDAEDMQPVLTRTEREVRDRYKRVRAGEIEVEDLHPILLVIDEGAEMTQSLQTWWSDNKPPKGGSKPPGMNAWRSVARLGREARVHLVFGIQQAAASFFEGTEARSNFSCRIALGPTESTSAEMTFGQSWVGRDVPVTAKGRATWTTGDEGRFAEIQTYYSPELRPTGRPRNEADADVVRRWHAAARQAWPEIEREPASTFQSPVEVEGDLQSQPAPELEVAAETSSEVRETPAVPSPTEDASSPTDDGKPRCRQCERPVKARGLCTKHYHRARRAGEFTTTREEAHG